MSKKVQKKQQQKVINDHTFGLKNKNKSKVVQKYIKGVVNTVKNHGKSEAMLEAEAIEMRKQKKKEEQEKALLDSLFHTAQQVREAGGSSEEEVDPKSIVCPYFKQGLCQKGKKCKYSHDLTLDKGEDLDLYMDQRTQLIMNEYKQEDMANWDEEKLMNVIREKEKSYVKQKPTQIVCKYFLDALEKGKYNWNWECNNGTSCHYRHCLPPGFVLKRNMPKDDKEKQMSVEEKIDAERQKLFASEDKKGQLVTYEVFLKWKADKQRKRQEDIEIKKKEDEKKNKGGKQHLLSGRALFQFDPTLFVDDDEAADEKIYHEREEVQAQEEEAEVHHLDDPIEGEQQPEVDKEQGEDGDDEQQDGEGDDEESS